MSAEKSGPLVKGRQSGESAGREATGSRVATSTPTLTAALDYADKLIPTFFLSSSKRPLANCRDCNVAGPEHVGAQCDHLVCHGHLAATCDPDRLKLMANFAPRGLLAIRTGAVSGLVVVDIDPRHGGDESLRELIRSGLLPPTQRVLTGRAGQHLYYQHPCQRIASRPLPGWPGVDIKADGGYVVAPPSVHPQTGKPYQHVDDGRSPVEVSPALLAVLTAGPAFTAPAGPATQVVATQPTTGGIRAPQSLLEALLATVARAPEGSRRLTLFGAAHGVARIIRAGALSSQDGYSALINACHQAGWEVHRGTERAIRDGFSAEGVAL